jgi:hypothetical protein
MDTNCKLTIDIEARNVRVIIAKNFMKRSLQGKSLPDDNTVHIWMLHFCIVILKNQCSPVILRAPLDLMNYTYELLGTIFLGKTSYAAAVVGSIL